MLVGQVAISFLIGLLAAWGLTALTSTWLASKLTDLLASQTFADKIAVTDLVLLPVSVQDVFWIGLPGLILVGLISVGLLLHMLPSRNWEFARLSLVAVSFVGALPVGVGLALLPAAWLAHQLISVANKAGASGEQLSSTDLASLPADLQSLLWIAGPALIIVCLMLAFLFVRSLLTHDDDPGRGLLVAVSSIIGLAVGTGITLLPSAWLLGKLTSRIESQSLADMTSLAALELLPNNMAELLAIGIPGLMLVCTICISLLWQLLLSRHVEPARLLIHD